MSELEVLAAKLLSEGRDNAFVFSELRARGASTDAAAMIIRSLGDRPMIERMRFKTTVRFPVYGVEMVLTHVTEERGEVRANIDVRKDKRRTFSDSRANLSSMRDRRDLVNILDSREGGVPWDSLVDYVATVAHDEARRSGLTEAIDSVDIPVQLPKPLLLAPYFCDGHPTLLVAEPEVGKSTLALAVAMEIAGMHGTAPWRAARRMNVLYLDFEYGQEEWTDNVASLLRGRTRTRGLFYMHGGKPLKYIVDEVARQIDEHNIGYIVIDAITGAAGDLIDANSINRFAESIRALNVGSLWIAHVDKETMKQSDKARSNSGDLWEPPNRTHPYGGALWLGHVRSKIVLHEDGNFSGANQPQGEKRLVLKHEKNQRGKWQKPLGLTLFFSGGLRFEATGEWKPQRASLSAPSRTRSNIDLLRAVMADGEPRQERVLRDRSGITSVSVLANTLREIGAISDGMGGWRLPLDKLDSTMFVVAESDEEGEGQN